VVNQDFSTYSDGQELPSGWCKYSGLDHVFGISYYNPANVYVRGGLLHLLSQYNPNGPDGAHWYTGGFSFKGSTCGGSGTGPFGLSMTNGRFTVRMRVVENGGTGAEGHRNVIFWPDSGQYYQGGEEDMWESDRALNNATLFLHYDNNGSPAQIAWPYSNSFDWSQWHTFRFQKLDGVISIYVDDMTTPVEVYTGNSTTLPDTTKHWVMQQQARQSAVSSDTEDWQVAWITIDDA
jgi:hypothetical protein